MDLILRTILASFQLQSECYKNVLKNFIQDPFTLVFVSNQANADMTFKHLVNTSYEIAKGSSQFSVNITYRAEQIIIIYHNSNRADVENWTKHPKWSTRARILVLSETEFPYTNLTDFYLGILHSGKFREIARRNCRWINKEHGDLCSIQPIVPQKTYPLTNCRFTAIAYNQAGPFTASQDLTNEEIMEGTDLKILKTLADFYNFSFLFRAEPDFLAYLPFDKDRQFSGFLKQLMDRTVDFVGGAVRRGPDWIHVTEYLDPFYGDDYMFLVPSPKLSPPHKIIFKIFPLSLWIAILLTWLVTSFILRLVNSSKSIFSWIFHTWLQTTSVSYYRPQLSHERVIILIYAVYILIINTLFQSSFIKSRSFIHYEEPYETPLDATERGLILELYPTLSDLVNVTDHKIWNKILTHMTHVTNFSATYRRVIEKKSFIIMARSQSKYYVLPHATAESGFCFIKYMEIRFFPYDAVILMRKDHPERQRFERKIRQMSEGGLVKFWEQEVIDKSFERNHKRYVSDLIDPGENINVPRVITLNDLTIVFVAHLTVLLVALIAFAFELLF